MTEPTNRVLRLLLAAAAVLGGGIATTACAAPSSSSVASLPGHHAGATNASSTGPLTEAQIDTGMVQFARCLRSHGVNEPDPAHVPGHSGLSVQIPPSGPGTNAALAACNHFLAPLMAAKRAHANQQLASWLPALTQYAQCMRTHDVPMLDPDSSGNLNLGNVPGINSDFGRYSPQFRSADATCRHYLPAEVRARDNGTGP